MAARKLVWKEESAFKGWGCGWIYSNPSLEPKSKLLDQLVKAAFGAHACKAYPKQPTNS